MISVIITVHEPLLKHLQRCVDSVLWQMKPEDEIIVVGDRCVLPVIPARYGVSLRTYRVNYDVQSGECATRNLGLHNACAEWIKFLDADDLLAPFALAAFRSLAGKIPEKVAVVTGQQVKVVNGIVAGLVEPPDVDRVITFANPTLPSMTFVRRSAALDVKGFDERIDFEGDWDFWLRLRQAGYQFALQRKPYCYYWIDEAERAAKEKTRTHQVEGMDVRAYFAQTYGITPGGSPKSNG